MAQQAQHKLGIAFSYLERNNLHGRFGGLCVIRVIVPQAYDTKVTTYPSPKSTLTLTSHLGKIASHGTGRWSVIRHKYNTCEVAGVLLVFIRARFLKRPLSLTQD